MAILFLFLALRCAYLMYRYGPDYYLIGITGVFSIGYYVLPVMFQEYSGLDSFKTTEIFEVMVMSLLFFVSLYLGYTFIISRKISVRIKGLKFQGLDELFERTTHLIFFICISIWGLYVMNFELTGYQSLDRQAYFTTISMFGGLMAYFSELCLSVAVYITAKSIGSNNKTKSVVYSTFTFLSLIPLIYTAQRLAILSPFLVFVAALGLNGLHKLSVKVFVIAIAFLLAMSPVMVFMRELGNSDGTADISEMISSVFAGEDSYILVSFKSILARADLLSVMIQMKDYLENQSLPSFTYYLSVVGSYIPRFIWPSKPYPLSDDGTIYGEISVLAWSELVSNQYIGSLSSFGSIIAYREGGWLWVPFNGLLVGVVFALVYLILTRGGHISKILFCTLITSLAVKNVPPSFFTLIVMLSATFNVVVVLKIISILLPKNSRLAGAK